MKKVRFHQIPKTLKISHDIFTGHKPEVFYEQVDILHWYYIEDISVSNIKQQDALRCCINRWNQYNLGRK